MHAWVQSNILIIPFCLTLYNVTNTNRLPISCISFVFYYTTRAKDQKKKYLNLKKLKMWKTWLLNFLMNYWKLFILEIQWCSTSYFYPHWFKKSVIEGHVFTELWNTHLDIARKYFKCHFCKFLLLYLVQEASLLLTTSMHPHLCHWQDF